MPLTPPAAPPPPGAEPTPAIRVAGGYGARTRERDVLGLETEWGVERTGGTLGAMLRSVTDQMSTALQRAPINVTLNVDGKVLASVVTSHQTDQDRQRDGTQNVNTMTSS